MPLILIDAQRVRLANLTLQLLQVQRRRDFLVAAILLEDQRQHQQQRRRTMWVKPWLLRRVTLGHYDTLMQELMRESRGDFKSFLRMGNFFNKRIFCRVKCTTALLISFFVFRINIQLLLIFLGLLLISFFFSDTLCSALSAYFDIMMLTVFEVYGLHFSNF